MIIERPTVDEHGNTVCTMQRYGAGEFVEVIVVIVHGGGESRLIVTNFATDRPD